MKFQIEKNQKEKDKTFSEEAIYSTLVNINDFTNQMFAKVLKEGFEKKEPVQKIEIDIKIKANDKEVDIGDLLEKYPEKMGISEQYLAEIILKRAGVIDDR